MSVIAEQLDNAILRAGTVDYLDVWFITGLVAEMANVAEEDAARDLALKAIGRLLRTRRLRAGDLQPPGEFVAWPDDPGEALLRIRARLRSLNGPLKVGDVAWFRLE